MRQSTAPRSLIACLLLLSAAIAVSGVAATASDGRTPIWQPGTISVSGAYTLTRSITEANGLTALRITANDVDIDLNGMTVRSAAIGVDEVPIVIQGNNVRIYNGTVWGDLESPPAIEAVNVNGIVLENLYLRSGGTVILTNVRRFSISRVVSRGGFGIGVLAANCGYGTIEDNEFEGGDPGGISVSGTSIEVSNNKLEQNSSGIWVSGSGHRIVGNQVTGGIDEGIRLNSCNGCLAKANQVVGSQVCMAVSGAGNTVSDNICRSTDFGMDVSGDQNLLERNQITDSATGGFTISGDNNVYRGNFSRGNGTNFGNTGTGNTSAGDNYLPNLQ